jgi:hypothetical protein
VHRMDFTPAPLREPLVFGPILTPLCEGPYCLNRTAPVLVSPSAKGTQVLCGLCRAQQTRVIRAAVAARRGW